MTQSDCDIAVPVPLQAPTQSSSLPAVVSPTEQTSLSFPQPTSPVTAVTGAEVRELHRAREEAVANAWAEAEMVVTEPTPSSGACRSGKGTAAAEAYPRPNARESYSAGQASSQRLESRGIR